MLVSCELESSPGELGGRVAELQHEIAALRRTITELQDRNAQLLIGAFTFGDLAERLNAQLLARHPERHQPAPTGSGPSSPARTSAGDLIGP